MSKCLSNFKNRAWDYEPLPSSRTPYWKTHHRFTLEEAKRLALEEYPKLKINGWVVRDGQLVRP